MTISARRSWCRQGGGILPLARPAGDGAPLWLSVRFFRREIEELRAEFVASLEGREIEPKSLSAVPASDRRHRNRESVKLNLAREAAIEIWPPNGVAPKSLGENRIHQLILDQLRKRPDLKE